MKIRSMMVLALAAGSLAACDDGGKDKGPVIVTDCEQAQKINSKIQNCVEINVDDEQSILDIINDDLPEYTALVLGEGTFALGNGMKFYKPGIYIYGQGMDKTVLDFNSMRQAGVQDDGIYAQVERDFLVQDLTVIDSVKDGIKVEDTTGVVYRRIKTTWSTPGSSENGPYGIYPVKVRDVLVEDSIAEHASDAGLYVGQCQRAVVRNNIVTGNVAGLEIENTQYAEVYGNLAENNTAGIVVFDMAGNPIPGRDIKMFNNIIRNNNHKNFAPGGVVESIPAGTGTFAMASRRVEIFNNTYENNQTVDIALISGTVGEGPIEIWTKPENILIGDVDDLDFYVVEEANEENGNVRQIANHETKEVHVWGNTYSGSGKKIDMSREFGLGLTIAFPGSKGVPTVVYELADESSQTPADASAASNDMRICIEGATMGLANFAPALPFGFRMPEALAPYDCEGFSGGPIVTPNTDVMFAVGK